MEFLTVPTLVVGGFLLLAAATYLVDDIWAGGEKVLFEPVTGGLFRDPQSARDLLGVIATSIITVTSITFSLLLIAVQQGAAALTNQVFDQFLRRRANQLYFGFFIGVALYALAMLASIGPSHQPVLGVILAFAMTVVALCALIWLIYATIVKTGPAAERTDVCQINSLLL